MKVSKKNIVILAICLLTAIFVSVFLFIPRNPRVLIKVSGYDLNVIYSFVDESFKKFKLKPVNSLEEKKLKSPDFVIDNLGYFKGKYKTIDNSLFNSIPRSIARTGVKGDKPLFLPIFLDHVEIAFRADLFIENGLYIDDRILSLDDLENVLIKQTAPAFYPLVMAGKEDNELLDVISVLTLSLGGSDAYLNLVDILNSNDLIENLISLDLGDGWSLEVVVDKLLEWKEMNIVHPQWYNFDTKQVELYSERQITSAAIMRLSTHRSWPFHILRRWQSSPFPFKDTKNTGSGIIAPPVVAYIPENSRFYDKSLLVLKDLVSTNFQEFIVKKLGLAPVHSTVDTLDRESDDLRFWAAASNKVLPSLTTSAPNESLLKLVTELRLAIESN